MINKRPLGVRVHGKAEGDLIPITPNLLLMAKTTTTLADPSRYEDGPDKFVRKQKMMEEVLSAWWDKWYSQVVEVEKDAKGLVRKVMVAIRPSDAMENLLT